MDNKVFQIRVATEADAHELLEIYRPYVEHTAITFEYETPSVQEFAGRIRDVLKRFPYLVVQQDGKLLGYAYASSFHTRAAYRWAVETSIYVRADQKRQGVGRALYQALEDVLKRQNILNLNACIAYPEIEDQYLNKDSVAFHEKMGYRFVGRFDSCGYKFHRWYHMIWMEKHIGAHDESPQEVKNFDQVRQEISLLYGIN